MPPYIFGYNLFSISVQRIIIWKVNNWDEKLATIYIGYLSRKVSFWLFKILEIQKGRTFNFNYILRLCTIVVNIAIRSRA